MCGAGKVIAPWANAERLSGDFGVGAAGLCDDTEVSISRVNREIPRSDSRSVQDLPSKKTKNAGKIKMSPPQ